MQNPPSVDLGVHDRLVDFSDLILPYRSTPVFDEGSLPAALRGRHSTKAGVWGVVRVLEGQLKLTYLDPESETVLDPQTPGLLLPGQPHFVEPLGAMKMRVEFYNEVPKLGD